MYHQRAIGRHGLAHALERERKQRRIERQHLGVDGGIGAVAELDDQRRLAGIEPIAEIYADRGYTEKGGLIPRGQKGAMIEDPDEAADRVVKMVEAGAVITASGAHLKAPIRSVCVHGDSPHAVESARRVRAKLEAAGVKVAPFSGP